MNGNSEEIDGVNKETVQRIHASDDWDLIGALKSGDAASLKSLMALYGNEVLRTAVLLLKDRHLAEDVSQETFLTAYQRIGQYRGDGSLRGWLLRITVNLCRSRMRRASWRRLLFPGKLDDNQRPAEDGGQFQSKQPEPGSDDWIDSMSLRQEIEMLPYKYREVVVLYYYQEFTTKEIASILIEPENTIKSKLLRARKLLRRQLEEGGWRHGETLG